MKAIQSIGLLFFLIGLLIFTGMLGLNKYTLHKNIISYSSEKHQVAIDNIFQKNEIFGKTYSSSISLERDLLSSLKEAQTLIKTTIESDQNEPPTFSENIENWQIKQYKNNIISASSHGPVHHNPWLFFLLTFGMCMIGGLLFILPKIMHPSGIKNDGIFQSVLTAGIQKSWKTGMIVISILGLLIYGYYYLNGNIIWSILTLIAVVSIHALVMFKEKDRLNHPPRSSSPNVFTWLGILLCAYFVAFYILLYWAPQHINAWITMVSPISQKLSGNSASNWFLYGLMYTIIVLVMGIRMMIKYRHNRYQIVRTISVIFCQICFAFLLPEILVRLNYPWYDFKNIWPLNYSFFFDYNIRELSTSGSLGIFMLVWGIVLILVGVPVLTYFFGKRWYCSWVCGCGGLAETLGDPFRQLSDKSLRAWKYERWIIHGVLIFAILMTLLVLYTYFTGKSHILILDSYTVRSWYGFLIGSAFAGIVGTGFYPVLGNRVWCRFGCPLAAYLGLVQKLKSRFRITTNGGQCISCGNCSTYCEMGIDVRWYAQRGQDIVRSSCVGCGVCSAVCPRGVLRLENGSIDINTRADQLRTIHFQNNIAEIEMETIIN